MSPFEFFFSFYGLLLALSVAVVATGAVRALKTRPLKDVGWLTPLLAVFVMTDIASFWSWAWDSMRTMPFSYGLLLLGMLIALIYFFAASFVFPEENEKWKTLDDHYDARKRIVLIGVMVSTTVMFAAALGLTGTDPFGALGMLPTIFYAFYVITLGVCCLVRNRMLNAVLLVLNILLYIVVAWITINAPPPSLTGG